MDSTPRIRTARGRSRPSSAILTKQAAALVVSSTEYPAVRGSTDMDEQPFNTRSYRRRQRLEAIPSTHLGAVGNRTSRAEVWIH